ncbi:MAG TPA: AraC family transcriptional regulator [Solirubrobacterales bacterium]|jgi:AraC-like DNA-binding protein|nr:AraC family transcriptional regulator [Solirubrobacterales bacterium]
MLDRPACWTFAEQARILAAMPEHDPPGPSDPLGEALHFLRINGVFYSRAELTAPWGLTVPPMGDLWFHVVVSGEVMLEVKDADSASLRRGDFALVARSTGHALRSEPGVPAPGILELEREQVSDRYEVLRHGGGGTPTTSICGAVRFDNPAARDLIEILPSTIHVEPSDPPSDWMQGALGLMAAEAKEPRPGGEAVITRLADILVIQALRFWIATDPAARRGWLGALRDPQIGRAIALIHGHPERAWTVASLAGAVAMSRSAFAARFSELVGEPVMQYVTRWRMQVAHDALRSEGATVAELATRLGYRSEAAFGRAFKREMGISPGAAKRGTAI